MSKLDGNERWKSKMLLTEHQEQYEHRHDAKNSRKRPTEDELIMIRDCILLPYMLSMVQKSIEDIENRSNLLKQLYLTAGRVLMNRISADLYRLRRELSRRNIKIMNDEQADMVIYHRFICRGYEERFGMVRDVMRSEISIRLSKYVKELAGRMSANE
ncbi:MULTISPECIES: hypothetical protein [unclassified Paenibacillus]|uniref:hypothetical protein n=1 Tax=unclassified Paenibacillus TaxID=185978 RepID=UPI001C11371B|nr:MULTISPECIES: hypothetical protein [unclassified Paenibacillus]MBU5444236.1 hypothetical protein [Paenibacillus sp. MSJ-34]CAH0120128.1 hypothetical protein PAE9249_02641 [Paenibacillus sp. CECT 9249]